MIDIEELLKSVIQPEYPFSESWLGEGGGGWGDGGLALYACMGGLEGGVIVG